MFFKPGIYSKPLASGDPDFGSVQLLTHMDVGGPIDYSSYARTITAFGSPSINTTDFKFGDGSMQCALNASYQATPLPALGNYTVEYYIRFTAFTGLQGAVNLGGSYVEFLVRHNSATALNVWNKGTEFTFTMPALSLDTWYLIEVSRETDGVTTPTMRAFLDGTLLGAQAYGSPSDANSGACIIGASGHSGGEYVRGQIDEVRISDIVRNTASYTPSPNPFPNS